MTGQYDLPHAMRGAAPPDGPDPAGSGGGCSPSRPDAAQEGQTGLDNPIRTKGSTVSVYRVIDVIGTSSTSWEEAAAEAITTAGGSLRDLRVAEVTKQDVVVGDDGGLLYRTKVQLSFKYVAD